MEIWPKWLTVLIVLFLILNFVASYIAGLGFVGGMILAMIGLSVKWAIVLPIGFLICDVGNLLYTIDSHKQLWISDSEEMDMTFAFFLWLIASFFNAILIAYLLATIFGFGFFGFLVTAFLFFIFKIALFVIAPANYL